MAFGIFISIIVLVYMLGVVAALKVFDRTTELPESQRAVARARAGVFWPVSFVRWVSEFVARSAAVPSHDSMGIHSDLYM